MEELVKSINLENNQQLDIYDASIKLAGDRWQVNLVARMVISVDDLIFENNTAGPSMTDIKSAIGDTVVYEIKKQRNFIGDTEKPAAFKQLMDTLEKFSAPYLAHPEFPKRVVLKKYWEWSKRIQQ